MVRFFTEDRSNKLHDKACYWVHESQQLVTDVENAMFSKSVILDNLNYDLASDEDLLLFQKVEFEESNNSSTGWKCRSSASCRKGV